MVTINFTQKQRKDKVMKKEELKEKAKGFLERNKFAIACGMISGFTCLIGYKWAMYDMGVKKGDLIITNENLKLMILDAQNKYGGDKANMTVFQKLFDEAVKPEELGKLGEAMIAINEKLFPGTDPRVLTHFIAFGPTK